MITSVVLLTNTEIAPLVPAGTMAALATMAPLLAFNVETTGCDWPVGQMLRYSRGAGGTAVTLSENASAVEGTPQFAPVTWKLRVLLPAMVGGPNWPVLPCPVRVSATRQGVRG